MLIWEEGFLLFLCVIVGKCDPFPFSPSGTLGSTKSCLTVIAPLSNPAVRAIPYPLVYNIISGCSMLSHNLKGHMSMRCSGKLCASLCISMTTSTTCSITFNCTNCLKVKLHAFKSTTITISADGNLYKHTTVVTDI